VRSASDPKVKCASIATPPKSRLDAKPRRQQEAQHGTGQERAPDREQRDFVAPKMRQPPRARAASTRPTSTSRRRATRTASADAISPGANRRTRERRMVDLMLRPKGPPTKVTLLGRIVWMHPGPDSKATGPHDCREGIRPAGGSFYPVSPAASYGRGKTTAGPRGRDGRRLAARVQRGERWTNVLNTRSASGSLKISTGHEGIHDLLAFDAANHSVRSE